MKAIILNQPKDFSIKEIDKPQIKDDEVLIRVKASGICTNDVRDFNGDCNYSYPRIGGHEYGGVIEEIGAAVNKAHFKKGDKVVLNKYSGTEVKYEGEDLIIVKQNDILAIVE